MMPSELHGHLSEDDVERYCLGDLPEPELAPADEHLLLCAACRQRVEAGDAYLRAMRQAGAHLRRTPERAVPWLRLVFAACSAAVILSLAVPASRHQPAPLTVQLTATRAAAHATVTEGAPLILVPDLTGLPHEDFYRMEMVDRTGKRVWSGRYPRAEVNAPAAGIFFVRLSTPSGELLREYGLEVMRQK